jgi:hypothetical protein
MEDGKKKIEGGKWGMECEVWTTQHTVEDGR